MYGKTFQCHNYPTLFPIEALLRYVFLPGLDALQNEPNFMLVHYSITELLKGFKVSAQHEYTIDNCLQVVCLCKTLRKMEN